MRPARRPRRRSRGADRSSTAPHRGRCARQPPPSARRAHPVAPRSPRSSRPAPRCARASTTRISIALPERRPSSAAARSRSSSRSPVRGRRLDPRATSTRARVRCSNSRDVGELVVGREPVGRRPSAWRRRGRRARPALRPSWRRRAVPAARSRWCRAARPRRAGAAPRRGRPRRVGARPWPPASGRGAAGGPCCSPSSARWRGGARRRRSRSLRSVATRLSPTCMSRCAAQTGVLGGVSERRLERALCVVEPALGDLDVGEGEGAAHDVGQEAPGLEASRSTRRSGRELCRGRPGSSAPARAARRRLPRRSGSSSPTRSSTRSAWCDGRVGVAGEEREARSVHRRPWREGRAYSSASVTIGGSSSRPSQARARSSSGSTPAVHRSTIRAPTSSMVSTGRSA